MSDEENIDEEKLQVSPHWGRLIVILCLTSISIWAVERSGLHNLIESGLTRRIDYQVRTWLKRDPPLDPRIKMIAFDDYTAGVLQRPDLTLDDWGNIISYFAQRKPKSIFIDRIFGLPLGKQLNTGLSEENAENFVKKLQGLETPVVVGAFTQPVPITKRPTLALTPYATPLSQYETDPISFETRHPWAQWQKTYVYGPHAQIAPAFSHIGLINNAGHGRLQPFARVGPDHIMAHSAILATQSLQYQNHSFYVNDHLLPIRDDGLLTLNFSHRNSYYTQTQNLLYHIQRLNQQQSADWVEEGDIVVILPMMYTGNTDMKDTPIGRLQGSYVNVTAINNMLNGNWLQVVPSTALLIFIAAATAMLAAIYLNPLPFAFAILGLLGLHIAMGQMFFSFADYIYPWPYASLACLLAGGIAFVDKSKRMEQLKQRALIKAEEGRRVRQLLHVVCHDIANPLMTITTRAKILGADPTKVTEHEAEATGIDKISFAAEKVRSIINAVRNLEAVETGKASLQQAPVLVSDILDTLPISFEDKLRKKSVQLVCSLQDQDLSVMADATSLENFVIHNLVSNAIKFSPKGGKVTVEAMREQGKAVITITDQGIGMPPELLKDLFSPVIATTRLGTDNERGTGFGMPIVKSYVEKFQGSITVISTTASDSTSQRPQGTKVTLTFKEAPVVSRQKPAPEDQ